MTADKCDNISEYKQLSALSQNTSEHSNAIAIKLNFGQSMPESLRRYLWQQW